MICEAGLCMQRRLYYCMFYLILICRVDGAEHWGEAHRKMEHDRNQFIVNVFTNGAAPEEKRGDSQEHDMAYIESCREMFRLRQKLQHDISSKEEGK